MSLSFIKKKHTDIVVEVVSDLDRLISKPVGFRLLGRVHAIKPMSTEQFLVVSNELGKIDSLIRRARESGVSSDYAVDRYFKLFSACIDTITKEDLNKMTYPQIAALFQLILNCVNGKAQVEEEKKNLVQSQTPA